MLGMAFHPDYPATRQVFVSYTTGSPMVSQGFPGDPRQRDDARRSPPEQVLLTVDQPFSNHNGGDIAFGPDGYLYFGLGDGGSGNDPFDYAQNTTRLLGKMLRIDVVGVALSRARLPHSRRQSLRRQREVRARRPTRPAARRSTPAACAIPGAGASTRPPATCGSGTWGRTPARRSTASSAAATTAGTAARASSAGPSSCSPAGLIDPLSDYPHANGDNSITGGFVYRGNSLPALRGPLRLRRFRLRADLGPGGRRPGRLQQRRARQHALQHQSPSAWARTASSTSPTTATAGSAASAARAAAAPTPCPPNLADTGCVDPVRSRPAPASGLIPYAVNAPFWSDGAGEGTLPRAAGRRAHRQRRRRGTSSFPAGSVLVKSFRLGGQLIETRLLMRHPDGVWAGYTYEWNDAADGRHARDRRQDPPGGRADLDLPERGRVHAVPHVGGGLLARPRDRPAERHPGLPATQA